MWSTGCYCLKPQRRQEVDAGSRRCMFFNSFSQEQTYSHVILSFSCNGKTKIVELYIFPTLVEYWPSQTQLLFFFLLFFFWQNGIFLHWTLWLMAFCYFCWYNAIKIFKIIRKNHVLVLSIASGISGNSNHVFVRLGKVRLLSEIRSQSEWDLFEFLIEFDLSSMRFVLQSS